MGIQQQRQYKILLIGDSCIDEYIFGRCERLSPEAPVPVLKVLRQESRPGMSANVRQNLEGLGCSVTHVTSASKIKKIRVIDESFNQHIVRIDDHDHVDPISLSVLKDDSFLTQFDAFVFSDYNKGFLSDSSISQIIKMIKQACQDSIIFVDSKKKNLLSYGDAIIKINKREYGSLIKYSKGAEFVITLGDNGARHLNHTYPAFKLRFMMSAGPVILFSRTSISVPSWKW